MNKLDGYLKQFVIQFSGLKLGLHEYEFEIVDLFFERFNIEDVTGGELAVNFSIEKRETRMELNFEMQGFLKTTCDRCLDPLSLPISTNNNLMVRFGDTTSTENDELLVLGPEAYLIDIAPYLYEFLTLQFPLRKVHAENDCNQDVIDRLHVENDESSNNDDTNNMWDKLKELK